MRALLQRVRTARVEVDGTIVGAIEQGLVAFIGVMAEDAAKDGAFLVNKILNLRIFANDAGRFDRSVLDVKGGLLIVSQFTLAARTKGGNRPDFMSAAHPDLARPLFEAVVSGFKASGLATATGVFGAHMEVHLINDGPVTIILDSRESS